MWYVTINFYLGAYGTAVLYRKKDDDSLVILKEISILDLNAAERQASMNEVSYLSCNYLFGVKKLNIFMDFF